LFHGYSGRIIRVDLTRGRVLVSDLDEGTVRVFLGGLGFNAKVLYDEVGPGVGAFDPDNLVLFTPGALTGTAAPASPSFEVTTKSPLTGLIGTGNARGYWGPRLKRAGL
jgi:aldehyde:ferredoxin oxidoreductase